MAFIFSAAPVPGVLPGRLTSSCPVSSRSTVASYSSQKRPRPQRRVVKRSPPDSGSKSPNPSRRTEVRDLSSSERLQKILAHMGVASRRKAEDLILNGHVSVNGKVITENGTSANPYTDCIAVDGETVTLPSKPMWLAIHKPRGMSSTPREGSITIADAVQRAKENRLVVVGPIDEEASGLILMTNERFWAQELSKPDDKHVKEWLVDCYGDVTRSQFKSLCEGVTVSENVAKVVPTVSFGSWF